MEEVIRELYKHCKWLFDETIQKYNSNITTYNSSIDLVIDYKIKNNKDVIYKEDILKILGLSQEEFMENIIEYVKYDNLDINNLKYSKCYNLYLRFYYMSTFLENESVDIKIALKD